LGWDGHGFVAGLRPMTQFWCAAFSVATGLLAISITQVRGQGGNS
jgi:hypothetical protein